MIRYCVSSSPATASPVSATESPLVLASIWPEVALFVVTAIAVLVLARVLFIVATRDLRRLNRHGHVSQSTEDERRD